ncbi:4Fe-4S dicluster domain-containing protein [Methanosarcina sp.]|uniref:4Fe-4S dicluster domain-containing protein n=1 Tax=Methanosarcina sp. TaxID=2213 RepID=UPI002C07BF3D|nr:4Fe-4S dicluster domain-containing protein [Methanosarcina sp.]HOW15587.1 4Fe-4S dicluster domain-containing protein [Methanosarcina sp.]
MGMLNLVLTNVTHKPATRLYPFEIRAPFKEFKGRIAFAPENCILCGLCQKKCPPDAITVTKADKTWEINLFRCIMCTECVAGCPKNCLSVSNERVKTGAKETVKVLVPVVDKPKADKAAPSKAASSK